MEKEKIELIEKLQPLFRKKEWKTGDRAYHLDCGVGIFHKERIHFNGFSLRSDNKKILYYPREGELWKMVDWSKFKPAELQININGLVYTGEGRWEDLELALLKTLNRQEQENNQISE
ncbi:MAG: hypothetical protein ABFD50_23830 [Smithella sp.]